MADDEGSESSSNGDDIDESEHFVGFYLVSVATSCCHLIVHIFLILENSCSYGLNIVLHD